MRSFLTTLLRGRVRSAGRLLVAGFAVAIVVATPAAARADDEHGSERAFDLVRQAIALIVNIPDDHDMIAERIDDALKASDASGVQVPLVQQAKDALEAGDVHQARRLLEQSIGARVHTGPEDPVPIGNAPPAIGAETGTLAAVDGIPGRHGLSGGDWVMLAISVAVALGGVGLAVRLRPRLPHALPRSGSIG